MRPRRPWMSNEASPAPFHVLNGPYFQKPEWMNVTDNYGARKRLTCLDRTRYDHVSSVRKGHHQTCTGRCHLAQLMVFSRDRWSIHVDLVTNVSWRCKEGGQISNNVNNVDVFKWKANNPDGFCLWNYVCVGALWYKYSQIKQWSNSQQI